ncbi:unnamed protein product [Moneuplotes crassus]|uniref:Uncharacterized protein n=1 Tax=Euplotes crassus TaxID=5936 RepID=A0AAD1Y7R5_EUPCR|nr:unnamed protein product [Moneuplotes crassus]
MVDDISQRLVESLLSALSNTIMNKFILIPICFVVIWYFGAIFCPKYYAKDARPFQAVRQRSMSDEYAATEQGLKQIPKESRGLYRRSIGDLFDNSQGNSSVSNHSKKYHET